jgi:hypothetical protein
MTISLEPDRKVSLPHVAHLSETGHDVIFFGSLTESSNNLLDVHVFLRWSARALALRHTIAIQGNPGWG